MAHFDSVSTVTPTPPFDQSTSVSTPDCFQGDGVSASFNRLSYQVIELLIIYNKGNQLLGLTADDVQCIWKETLFGSDSILDLKSICENMITLEIATVSSDGASVRNLSLVQQGKYSSDGTIQKTIPQYVDSGSNTLVGDSDLISGYYRMVSYIIYSKLYPSWASEISGFTDLQEFIIPTGTVTVEDVEAEAEAESENVEPSNVSVTCG